MRLVQVARGRNSATQRRVLRSAVTVTLQPSSTLKVFTPYRGHVSADVGGNYLKPHFSNRAIYSSHGLRSQHKENNENITHEKCSDCVQLRQIDLLEALFMISKLIKLNFETTILKSLINKRPTRTTECANYLKSTKVQCPVSFSALWRVCNL